MSKEFDLEKSTSKYMNDLKARLAKLSKDELYEVLIDGGLIDPEDLEREGFDLSQLEDDSNT